jgi:hypothetical protein
MPLQATFDVFTILVVLAIGHPPYAVIRRLRRLLNSVGRFAPRWLRSAETLDVASLRPEGFYHVPVSHHDKDMRERGFGYRATSTTSPRSFRMPRLSISGTETSTSRRR